MIQINEYIYVSIERNVVVPKTSCAINQDDGYFYLLYEINSDDCLFELIESGASFQIKIDKRYFEKYNEKFEVYIDTQEICCNTQSKLLDLLNCKLKGIQKKIMFESIVLYLLHQTQKNNLIFQLDCSNCTFLQSPLQIDLIKAAKTYILENLSSNLTIPIIASKVGTNQCYLKKGFKEVYKQTIFDFIKENRMVRSRHLIEHSEKNMTEISMEMGYASLSSFSQSYKSYFGVSPKAHVNSIFPDSLKGFSES